METTFYTSDGSAYTGMSAETVVRLRAELGLETVFVTKEAYDDLSQVK